MINSAQIKRDGALNELKKISPVKIDLDMFWVEYNVAKRDYLNYPHSEFWWKLLGKIYKCFK